MSDDTLSRSQPSDFKLDDWWVRPLQNLFERNEESVQVEPRSMSVLVCLARHAPGLVSKEQLVDAVWRDSPHVGDDAITHAIWELRKALGDSARNARYIQTVSRKGYRVVAEILRPQGAPLPLEGVRIDHYEIGEELGRGAMGVVFAAQDQRLGRKVAVKFLAPELTRDPQAAKRFQREARIAATLEHPNLATIHEVGETSGGLRYLVGAFYGGGSLKDRLLDGAVPVDDALKWMQQLLAGLGAAHRGEILHRDIKPANLMLDEHGTLKICDFGIAKLLGATDLTQTGAHLGTPAYKSPEQAGGRSVDQRTDLWSAGVVLFELLTGRRPFEGEGEQVVVQAILSQAPERLDDDRLGPLSDGLSHFLARALDKVPEKRFQTAEEMSRALRRLQARPRVASRPKRTGRWVGLAAVAMLLLGLAWNTWQRPQPEPPPAVSAIEQDAAFYLESGRRGWLRGFDAANWKQVGLDFERAVNLMPESAEAQGYRAVYLAQESAWDKTLEDAARIHIERAKELDPESALPFAAEAKLILMFGTKEDAKRAEELARRAVELHPTCDDKQSCDLGYLWQAEALWKQDKQEEALAALDLGMEVGGGPTRCRLKQAQYFDKQGDFVEAEAAFVKVLEINPHQSTALQDLANFLYSRKRGTEALGHLKLLYDLTGDYKAQNLMGVIRFEHGLLDDAKVSFRRAFEDSGSDEPVLLINVGDVDLERENKEAAQVEYAAALELFDAMEKLSPKRQGQRAVCLAKLDRFDEAVKVIQELLPRAKDFPWVINYAARIYALKGDDEMLFELARQWHQAGQAADLMLLAPSLKAYRANPELKRILQPELFSIE